MQINHHEYPYIMNMPENTGIAEFRRIAANMGMVHALHGLNNLPKDQNILVCLYSASWVDMYQVEVTSMDGVDLIQIKNATNAVVNTDRAYEEFKKMAKSETGAPSYFVRPDSKEVTIL